VNLLAGKLLPRNQWAGRHVTSRGHHRRSPVSVRKRSRTRVAGLPLYEIAFGPNLVRGERHGSAHALLAIGDRATGVIAIGGLAQGIIAIGGLAEGLLAVGGCTLGLLAGLGGVAVGGLAVGGVAIGGMTRGGVSIGLKASGRTALAPRQ
jgi:hypothetical protein